MNKKRILVVEDDKKLNNLITEYLINEGYDVNSAFSGKEAYNAVKNNPPDLVLLDWMLPDESGLDICKKISEETDIPVIMLTAKSDELDKILGLEIGADDYITKPFSFRELAARIKVVLRRKGKLIEPEDIIKYGPFIVDLSKHTVFLDSKPIKLTPTEFKLLSHLIQRPGRVYSRLQLLEIVGEAYEGYERSLDTHVSNLRKKIEKNPNDPEFIVTVYGMGYKMEEQNNET